jgi:uncharacterized protein (TIGR02118 family)
VILLSRRDDTSVADFQTWWLTDHAPLARQLPGLRRAVFNVVESEPGTADCEIDGISELWFDNRADFDAAYATDIGRAVAADSIAHVRSRTRLFVDEHLIVEGVEHH